MPRVLVIGGGPAGCAAALTLASRGVETLLIERKTLPRPKICAGGLSPWTLGWLARHSLTERLTHDAYFAYGARLWTSSNITPLHLRSRQKAAVLPRSRFDARLAEIACDAGAELRQGLTVRGLVRDRQQLVGVETETGLIEADAVVVASGASGRLSPRPLGETERFFGIMTRYQNLEGLDHNIEIFLDPPLGLQYGWIFPEGTTVANVGLCFQRQRHGPNGRQLLDRFLDRHLGRRLREATPVGRVQANPLRPSVSPRRLVEEGVVYVGEAAGLVDPLTGEGIYYALRSGELAGQCLATLLGRKRPVTRATLAPYIAAVGLRLTPRLAVSAAALALIRSPLATPLAAAMRMPQARTLLERLCASV